MMVDNFERKCTNLLGECPLNIHEITTAESLKFSEKQFFFVAAGKHYLKEQHAFFKALCDWKDGNKMELNQEEAERRNHYFNNAKMIYAEMFSTAADTLVDWTAFPRDDPTICYYIGLPLDDELRVWAENY